MLFGPDSPNMAMAKLPTSGKIRMSDLTGCCFWHNIDVNTSRPTMVSDETTFCYTSNSTSGYLNTVSVKNPNVPVRVLPDVQHQINLDDPDWTVQIG